MTPVLIKVCPQYKPFITVLFLNLDPPISAWKMTGSTVALTATPSQALEINICEREAAEALLGVRLPVSYSTLTENLRYQLIQNTSYKSDMSRWGERTNTEPNPSDSHGFKNASPDDCEIPEHDLTFRFHRPRSGSTGLDTLAELALREQMASPNRPLPAFLLPQTAHGFSSSLSVDTFNYGNNDHNLPIQTPKVDIVGRHRSVSNPEGMEKWDSYGNSRYRSNRLHFVLPADILEEELAEANEAVRLRSIAKSPIRPSPIPEDSEFAEDEEEEEESNTEPCDVIDTSSESNPLVNSSMFETDDQILLPENLLRNARSRLLEDVSAESSAFNGDKIIALPHTLAKYKEVSELMATFSILLLFYDNVKLTCRSTLDVQQEWADRYIHPF
jgi:hypothetical protein